MFHRHTPKWKIEINSSCCYCLFLFASHRENCKNNVESVVNQGWISNKLTFQICHITNNNLSLVMFHVSHIRYHVSHVTCCMSCVTFFLLLFLLLLTKWWSCSIKGLFSMGPTQSKLIINLIIEISCANRITNLLKLTFIYHSAGKRPLPGSLYQVTQEYNDKESTSCSFKHTSKWCKGHFSGSKDQERPSDMLLC